MPPVTGVLDDFNRSDANPISGSWAQVDTVWPELQLKFNGAVRVTGDNFNWSYWTGSGPWDGDMEVWAKQIPTGFSTFEFHRLGFYVASSVGGTSAADGYQLIFGNSAHGWTFRRYTNTGFTDIGSGSLGGGIPGYQMLRRNGDDIEYHYSFDNVSWTLADSVDVVAIGPPVYTNGMVIALGATSNIGTSSAEFGWDYFGGGQDTFKPQIIRRVHG